MGQFWGLHVVSRFGPTSVRSVADHLLVSAPTACTNLDALVRAGLLERRRSEADRRVVEVALTPRGRRAEARVGRAIARMMDEGTRRIPRHDLEVAGRVFRSLVDRLEATDSPSRNRPRAS